MFTTPTKDQQTIQFWGVLGEGSNAAEGKRFWFFENNKAQVHQEKDKRIKITTGTLKFVHTHIHTHTCTAKVRFSYVFSWLESIRRRWSLHHPAKIFSREVHFVDFFMSARLLELKTTSSGHKQTYRPILRLPMRRYGPAFPELFYGRKTFRCDSSALQWCQINFLWTKPWLLQVEKVPSFSKIWSRTKTNHNLSVHSKTYKRRSNRRPVCVSFHFGVSSMQRYRGCWFAHKHVHHPSHLQRFSKPAISSLQITFEKTFSRWEHAFPGAEQD